MYNTGFDKCNEQHDEACQQYGKSHDLNSREVHCIGKWEGQAINSYRSTNLITYFN